MKRFGMIMLSMVFLLGVTGCSLWNVESKSENEAEIVLSFEDTETKNETVVPDFSQADLFAMFEEVNNEVIVDFYYDDYNKDGVHEAFVLTKTDCYRLWYMTADNCAIVKDELEAVDDIKSNIEGMQTKDYLFLQIQENDRKKTLVYSVDNNNQVYEPVVSGRGYIHRQPNGEIYLEIVNEVASQNDSSEATMNTYYLYYSLDEGFKEFGAIPISKEQFLEFEGSSGILENIEMEYADYQIDYSFLYRSNRYININVMLLKDGSIEYKNMTLVYDNSKVSVVSDGMLADGRIETAYMLGIATFPISFKHPVKQIAQ